MASVVSFFTRFCGFRKKSLTPETETGDRPYPPDEETSNRGTADLRPKEPENRNPGASEIDDSANAELPLPPSRKTLRETYSCNNVVMKSASKNKVSATLTIQVPRAMSMSLRREREGDRSVRKKKKLKGDGSILFNPIILGEKCRVPNDESDEDCGVKMQRNTTYHPRSMSSVRVDPNAVPAKETSKDSTRNETKQEEGKGDE